MNAPAIVLAAVTLATAAASQQRAPVPQFDPPHLATQVAAGRARLSIAFDQDMAPTTAAPGGGGAPQLLRARWAGPRTFLAEVELQPNRVYVLDLDDATGFRSAAGTAVRPRPWRFATAGRPLADGAAETAARGLFAAIRDRYAHRDRLGVDWDAVARRHGEWLLAAPDGPALALRCAEVLAPARDPHVGVRWHHVPLPAQHAPTPVPIDRRALQAAFPQLEAVGSSGFAGRTADGIGYLLVASFAREPRSDCDAVIAALRGLLDCRELVLDVRPAQGGDEATAQRLAAFFVPGERIYATRRQRDAAAPGGFRRPERAAVTGNPPADAFRGPVAVLMGPANLGASEAFLLMMKQAPRAFLVGQDSGGHVSPAQVHALLPGLSVLLPTARTLRPDGTPLEGEGIAPHIHVPPARGEPGADATLHEALQRLRSQR